MVEIKAAPVETVPAKVYECLTCTITKVIESKVIEIGSLAIEPAIENLRAPGTANSLRYGENIPRFYP